MSVSTIPKRFFVLDYESEEVDLKEVTEAEFIAHEGTITQERHTMWANGVDQICFYKGFDV